MPRTVKIDGETFVIPLRFCNEDCNNCDIHTNRQFSLLINALYVKFGEEVYRITQNICPNMTCCADCRIDDFCHAEDCEIANEAEALVAAWNRYKPDLHCDWRELTPEEAVAHCREVAARLGDTPCARDHLQLAEWIEERDRLRDIVRRMSDNLARYHLVGERDRALLREARSALEEGGRS